MLKKEDENLHTEYFRLTADYIKKYGTKTILFMEVGKFFEMYGRLENGKIIHSCICEVCEICYLELANTGYDKTLKMAGVPVNTLEKKIPLLMENGYTVVVHTQNPKNPSIRELHEVYSPGTFLSYDTEPMTLSNNSMCIWFDKYNSIIHKQTENTSVSTSSNTSISIAPYLKKQMLVYGVAVINILSGATSIFQHETKMVMNPTTFDELERCICTYQPSELIIVSDFNENEIHSIIQFIGVKCNTIHKIDSQSLVNTEIQNCMKQTYRYNIIQTYFGLESQFICREFEENNIATQSMCYLIHFLKEHNVNLVKQLVVPKFNNTSNRLILANHTLKQLNIIEDGERNKMRRFSSVEMFLNKCCTSMGKRKFRQMLLNPIVDIEWLQQEYDMTEQMMNTKNQGLILPFRQYLKNICDIELLIRQLFAFRVTPHSFYLLYKSVESIQQINVCLYESPEIYSYLCKEFHTEEMSGLQMTPFEYIEHITTEIIRYMDSKLNIDCCKELRSREVTFENDIIHSEIHLKYDELSENYLSKKEFIHQTKEQLNKIMQMHESQKNVEFIKENTTKKNVHTLELTDKRADTLKRILHGMEKDKDTYLAIYYEKINLCDIKMVSSNGKNKRITFPLLEKKCEELQEILTELDELSTTLFLGIVNEMTEKWGKEMMKIAEYISNLDVLQTKAYIAMEYNYCKPTIDIHAEKSFVDASDLRHVLIEHIQQNEIYVPNDLSIGTIDRKRRDYTKEQEDSQQQQQQQQQVDGILLYGTNAVGKTSIIRALGISVIMAQAGLYVPCSKYVFYPYRSIFSRILGNDNLFKGLSTFAVEMSELRVILNYSDKYSLILGDELCSGTENESALSIFLSGLIELNQRQSSFIFATHFHEIVHLDEIKEMDRIRICHLSVYYDREIDALVYDRKMKNGPGSKSYGLEVCKSLYLPDGFIERAFQIRKKYFGEAKGELSQKTSVYNARKIKGMCEICKMEIGEEIHHLQEQKESDKRGYIGTFHKNHAANLVNICKKCHDNIHYSSKKNLYSPTKEHMHDIDIIMDIDKKVVEKTTDKSAKPKQVLVKKKTTRGEIITYHTTNKNTHSQFP
jgi:DNA mismatch repair protein MutS